MGGCCVSTPLVNDQPPPQQQPQTQHVERKNDEVKNDDGFVNWPFTEFFLSDLTTATKNFSSDEIISENPEESPNVVYRGLLSANLGFVAIKRFKNTPWDDPDYFAVDTETAAERKHKRLVKLLGYCYDEDVGVGFLVSEFMPNDTLANRLFHQKNMDWSMRMRVAYNIAEALDYCRISRAFSYDNLSANSVLFDKDGEACLSSFGLVTAIIRYNRREGGNVNTGNVTYRFGTILVNLLTGMQIAPSHAPEMINGKDVTELIDPNLKGKYSKEEATVVLKLASECLQCNDYKERFITKEVAATLKALHAKKEVPPSEMQQNEASSSSQQQQLAP